MRVYTIDQMRRLEQASDDAGHSYMAMMEAAGKAVAWAIDDRLRTLPREEMQILALVGPGNNGGDGLVAARELAQSGYSAVAYLWKRDGEDPLVAQAEQSGVSILWSEQDRDGQQLHRVLQAAGAVIDALFGTGISRPIEGRPREILDALRQHRRPADRARLVEVNALPAPRATQHPLLAAVDVPSGLNGDSGAADEVTVPADLTITFAGPKLGMLTEAAAGVVGAMVVADIGIPAKVMEAADSEAMLLAPATVAPYLPPRSPYGHKGTFGTVVVVGGSVNFVGAPAMSGLAAGRSGAGLVTLAVPLPIQPVLATRPDLTTATWLLLPHDHETGTLREEAVRVLAESFEKAAALVVGPGLGNEAPARRFVWRLFGLEEPHHGRSIGFLRPRDADNRREERTDLPPTVIDADGLNALAAYDGAWWETLTTSLVLTPHPAEMGRLLGRPAREIQADRRTAAREAAARFGQVVVLKGAHTVVAAPDGRVAIAPFANDTLAKAGTGDVLAGIIGGLLGQGLDGYAAATLGVVAHGLAGERLRECVGRRGALASDLIDRLPEVWQQLDHLHDSP